MGSKTFEGEGQRGGSMNQPCSIITVRVVLIYTVQMIRPTQPVPILLVESREAPICPGTATAVWEMAMGTTAPMETKRMAPLPPPH